MCIKLYFCVLILINVNDSTRLVSKQSCVVEVDYNRRTKLLSKQTIVLWAPTDHTLRD